MLTSISTRINEILRLVSVSLDISPTDYDRAVRSYNAVGNWLEEGYRKGAYPESTAKPAIYPQGSINLGTIIRPIRKGKEADFDIDLVCELQNAKVNVSPELTKKEVGDRLKDNDIYRNKLDPEGKRCWTLTYAESEGIGFHMDVLPCVPAPEENHPLYQGAVSITNKNKSNGRYAWKPSNPKGFEEWFKDQNVSFMKLARKQKQRIFESHRLKHAGMSRYASINDIPDQLVRTPLQRVIQLMKRHRDIRFSISPKHKPISIIITTMAAHLYQGEVDIYTTLTNIVDQLAMHSGLVANRYFTVNEEASSLKLISRDQDGKWLIPNPINKRENFADRWHEDESARARAFFQWIEWLKTDVAALMSTETDDDLNKQVDRIFGKRVASDVLQIAKSVTAPKASLINRIGKAAVSLFNVAWRQQPNWPMRIITEFDIDARLSRQDGFRPYTFHYASGSHPLKKDLYIKFTAPSTFGTTCDYYWQITNTGDEARSASDLRGGFSVNSYTHEEKTKYIGKHCVQCFVVKNGVCVALSREFVVNIG